MRIYLCSCLCLDMSGSRLGGVNFEVYKLDGSRVGRFEVEARLHVADLRSDIATRTGACKCSFTLKLDDEFLRDCRSISRLAHKQHQQHPGLILFYPRSPDLSDKKDCLKYCCKCLADAGASALLILQIWVEARMAIDAAALHCAGFDLREVINARAGVSSLRFSHPPKSRHTLFDSQLKLAGYTACDFRQNGYKACDLSSVYFYNQDPEMTVGELEWDETMAFFTSDELLRGGFGAAEVRIAFDPQLWQSQGIRPTAMSRSRSRSSGSYRRGYAAGYRDGLLRRSSAR